MGRVRQPRFNETSLAGRNPSRPVSQA